MLNNLWHEIAVWKVCRLGFMAFYELYLWELNESKDAYAFKTKSFQLLLCDFNLVVGHSL